MRRTAISFLTQKFGMARFSFFLLPILFVFFADSMMSYTFPIIAERYLGSNTLLGVVMALSSVAGIICDLTFPALLRGTSWRFQLLLGITLAVLFPVSIHISVFFLPAFFAVFASVIWGVYYEMLMFAEQDMVVAEEDRRNYTRSWGLLYAATLFTSVIGPVVGAQLLLGPIINHTGTILLLQSIALCLAVLIMWLFKEKREHPSLPEDPQRVSAFKYFFEFLNSLKHWRVLFFAVLPAILMGVTTEWIEATFWMLGGLFGQEITNNGSFAWAVIILYDVPFIFGAMALAKLNISSGKKHWSQLALVVGGAILCGVFFARESLVILYGVIFVSSLFFSFASPLNDAVYSDLIDRLKSEKLYLVGLAKANSSIAYIASPIVMGMVADSTDYYTTFGSLGVIAVVIGSFLLLVTPRKLRLPQAALSDL